MDPLAIPSPQPLPLNTDTIRDSFTRRMIYSVAKDRFTASDYDIYDALAYAVRDRLSSAGSARRTPTTSPTSSASTTCRSSS